ncbi:MAG: hypothetical protein DRO11_07100 [Methanobacteriota archaeon]|nr:MAG: hypothetical protein DRO11_07100 [Euryarchaeota archaeon]
MKYKCFTIDWNEDRPLAHIGTGPIDIEANSPREVFELYCKDSRVKWLFDDYDVAWANHFSGSKDGVTLFDEDCGSLLVMIEIG